MPDFEIRHITGEELKSTYFPLRQYAFFSSPPFDIEGDYERSKPLLEETTILVGFEGAKPVGSVASAWMTQSIRGRVFPMGGILGVTSDPHTRRKGYVRRLMAALHQQLYEEQRPLATLYPFRESFYGRMGYVSFLQKRRYRLRTAALTPLLDWQMGGSVEYANVQEAWDIQAAFQKAVQAQIHGLGLFEAGGNEFKRQRTQAWLAIARDESGQAIGALTYKLETFAGTLKVRDVFYKNEQGLYLLLNWLARHVDQSTEIDIELAPHARPETWLSDMSIKSDPDIWITPMGRIIDIMSLQGLKVGEGQISLTIHDSDCAWNQGVFTFASDKGQLVITKGGTAECELSITGLSALIYGTQAAASFAFRAWGNLDTSQAVRLQRLFPLDAPYLYSMF